MLLALVVGACASLPPGTQFPRTPSVALADPGSTHLGRQFTGAAREHGDLSGYRIVSAGLDGFLIRAEMIDAAERTLDAQYFIFRGDETGTLLTDALLRAAERGVRVRILVDDGDTVAGDEQLLELAASPGIEIRIFNPFAYRGHQTALRAIEFGFDVSRLDYRMHNKLLVADNALALVGGRNIGNAYFQIDPESQFADADVLVAGPIATQLSATFDEYWNSPLAIPADALQQRPPGMPVADHRVEEQQRQQMLPLQTDGTDYAAQIATGEPYRGIISGRLPLVWAAAQLICDSPEKKQVDNGVLPGRLMQEAVLRTAGEVQVELLMVTPYFVPTADDLQLLKALRQRKVRVRILTNSLESTNDIAAQSGYARIRVALLEEGIELYEIRSRPGSPHGTGQTAAVSRYGNYSLHAKLFVFDRQKLLIGSMNFDQRSKHLNTEIGLIIDSRELAQQTVARFEAIAQPQNTYTPELRGGRTGHGSSLIWRTEEAGSPVVYTHEPARNGWQRLALGFFSLLPLDGEL